MTSPNNLSLYFLDEGNTFLINNQFQKAIEKFSSCIDTINETQQESQDHYIAFRAHSHRSQAYLDLKQYDHVKSDIEKCHAFMLHPNNDFDKSEVALTHLRLGRAQFELKEYEHSLESFQRAKSEFEIVDGDEYNMNLIDVHLKACEREISNSCSTKKSKEGIKTKPASSTSSSTTSTTSSSSAPVAQPTSSSSTTSKKPVTCPKYQYYQNDSFMTVSILEPNLTSSKINVKFSLDKLTVIIQKGGKNFTVICGTLFSATIVSRCKVKYTDEKILIKLKKKHKHDWNTLFGGGANSDDKEEDGSDEVLVIGELETENQPATTAAAAATATARPYASTKDWNAIDRELKRAEESETPGPDGAFNKFLQDIYKGADEDTRRAMIKSYQTSGGTHLSCNWNEVETTDYEKERTAPKGQEWKNWEGKKLPMKDDDDK